MKNLLFQLPISQGDNLNYKLIFSQVIVYLLPGLIINPSATEMFLCTLKFIFYFLNGPKEH